MLCLQNRSLYPHDYRLSNIFNYIIYIDLIDLTAANLTNFKLKTKKKSILTNKIKSHRTMVNGYFYLAEKNRRTDV